MVARRRYPRRRPGSSLVQYCFAMPLLRALDLQRLYGAELARPPLSEVRSAYLLHRALEARRPRIDTTKQAVKTWWDKYRRTPDGSGQRIHDVEMLESEYGDSLRGSIQE